MASAPGLRSERPRPAPGDFDGWLRTRWEGHRAPPFFVSHFVHLVRVRRTDPSTIEAEFFDDETRIPGAGGGVWRRIQQRDLAEQFYRQATDEACEEVPRG